jgi:uncharacterized protein (DUF1015 family)
VWGFADGLLNELVSAIELARPFRIADMLHVGMVIRMVSDLMPATVDHIRVISEHGDRMPAKSTYFYPKLLSGLVINPME